MSETNFYKSNDGKMYCVEIAPDDFCGEEIAGINDHELIQIEIPKGGSYFPKVVPNRELIESGSLKKSPLYGYAHGRVALSDSPFACPWDSGQVGFVYVSDKVKPARLGERLKYLTALINGDMHMVSVEEVKVEAGSLVTKEELFSCGGIMSDEIKEVILSDCGIDIDSMEELKVVSNTIKSYSLA